MMQTKGRLRSGITAAYATKGETSRRHAKVAGPVASPASTRTAIAADLKKLAFWLVITLCAGLLSLDEWAPSLWSKALAAESSAGKTGIAQCKGQSPLGEGGADAGLARGVNLPNWDPDYNGYKPDDFLLALLRKEGLSHIRLPVSGEKLMPLFTAETEIKAYLQSLNEEIARLKGLGFALIIDMHPGGAFQKLHRQQPEEGLKQLKQAWDRIIKSPIGRIKAGDAALYFELLNEPVPAPRLWWQQAQSLVDHVKAASPKARLIIGPANFQRYEPLLAATPLKGEGLIYAVHFYDPFLFTHQAMTWEPGSFLAKLKYLPFPADHNHPEVEAQIRRMEAGGDAASARKIAEAFSQPWTAERIEKVMAKLGDWSRKYDSPIVITEFGVLDFAVTAEARANWLRAVRMGAEKHCLGWTHWDFSDGFALVDPRTTLPHATVMDALLY